MMKHKLIGVYQLITGIFGVLLILVNIGKAFENSDIAFTVFLGLILFIGLTYSGYALFNDQRNSLKYSMIIQALQSISIIYGGTQFLFSGSAFLSCVIRASSYNFHYQISPIDFNISQVSTSIPLEIRIFVVPILIIVLLAIKRK